MEFLIVAKTKDGNTDISKIEAEGREHAALFIQNIFIENDLDFYESINCFKIENSFGVDIDKLKQRRAELIKNLNSSSKYQDAEEIVNKSE